MGLYDENIDNWKKISLQTALENAINSDCDGAGFWVGGAGTDKTCFTSSKFMVTNLSTLLPTGKRIPASYTYESHHIPQWMHDRLQNSNSQFFDHVEPASESAYVSKDGLVGVYASAISATGKIGKVEGGDTEALFSKHHTKESHWSKAATVKKILSDLKASASSGGAQITHGMLLDECRAIVASQNRGPTAARKTDSSRNVTSVGDYGARRQKTSDELLEDILEQKYQKMGWDSGVDFQLQYAKDVLKGDEIGAPVQAAGVNDVLSTLKQGKNVAFEVILFRPWMTYEMSSAILTKAGYDTGATFVGHSDFLLGDDVISKLHYGTCLVSFA